MDNPKEIKKGEWSKSNNQSKLVLSNKLSNPNKVG